MLFHALILALFAHAQNARAACTPEETAEAQVAFKNCFESAQSGIIEEHAKKAGSNEVEENGDSICQAIDSMRTICANPHAKLAECKGAEHAEKIRSIQLSTTAYIVGAVNDRVNVERCAAFHAKTAIPAEEHRAALQKKNSRSQTKSTSAATATSAVTSRSSSSSTEAESQPLNAGKKGLGLSVVLAGVATVIGLLF